MCGIAGAFLAGGVLEADVASVMRMADAVAHRGPDGHGLFRDGCLVMAHRRLSVIDVPGGGQPLYNEDGSIAVIVNGEIYNYVELRRELMAHGVRFRTSSDSEVVPFLYEQFGDEFIHRLRGAFAIALWDERRQRLLLARDRVGEKPLMYACAPGGGVLFASEIAALVASGRVSVDLDYEAINKFFFFRFVPEPNTPLSAVKKVPAGHYLVVSKDEPEPRLQRYWEIADSPIIDADPVEVIRSELDEIGRVIVRADVPIGIALSGGLDSSIVASLAMRYSDRPPTAFSVGYTGRPECDERADAAAFAAHLGMKMVEVELSREDVVGGFPRLVRDMSEPIADIAGFGYQAVMCAAKNHGVKVMFQGQGADELFWGYGWMKRALQENVRKDRGGGRLSAAIGCIGAEGRLPSSLRPRELAQWLVEAGGLVGARECFARINNSDPLQLVFWDVARPFVRISAMLKSLSGAALGHVDPIPDARSAFRGRRPGESAELGLVRAIFATYLLENGISQADRYGMASGVEVRLPFVDYQLVEKVVRLRACRSDAGLEAKAWLRDAVKGELPDWVMKRPKRGFSPPTKQWVGQLLNVHGESLRDGYLVNAGVLSLSGASFLAQVAGRLERGLRDQMAYQALVLEHWYRSVLELADRGRVAEARVPR